MSGLPKLISFALFLALCVSSAWWLMPLFSPAPRALSAPPGNTLSAPNISAAATLLGGQAGSVANSSYQLTGIVRAQNARDSVAILSTVGQPAISVKVGTKLAAEMSVSEIHADAVLLNDHGSVKRVPLATENKAALKVNQLSPAAIQ